MRSNIKNEKGITLIALIVTILVLIILSTVAINSGVQSVKSSYVTLFTTEMKIVQTQVNKIYTESNTFKDTDGQVITIGTDEYNQLKERLNIVSSYGYGTTDKDIQGYRLFTEQDLKDDLNIEGVKRSVYINLEKRKVVALEGVDYNGQIIYVLEQLPDNLYNVEYEANNTDKPTFDVKVNEIALGEKWQLEIDNIKYGGNISTWIVYYKTERMSTWNTSNSNTFVVNDAGSYSIKLVNGNIESDISEVEIERVNAPSLTSDMTPIYWDSEGNEIQTVSNDSKWYNYSDNRWANAKTSDGSYWVWIPRYAYKITSGLYTSTAGKIEVKFVDLNNSDGATTFKTTYPSVTGDAMDDYVVHPAFVNGTANKFANGEWDKDLPGIWVMKFEASSENPTATGGGGNVTNLAVKSVPGVPSWRSITVGNSYTNSYNYDRTKESHMMKNSEWGAVAYLTQSKYGRNGTEVTINYNTSYCTGGGEGEGFKTNVAQSTTENITGIYDFNGNAWEYTAGYIPNGSNELSSQGGMFATVIESTKYSTIYPYESVNQGSSTNYIKYKEQITTRYGDAILEISSAGVGNSSWFSGYTPYPSTTAPFFTRGGYILSDPNIGVSIFSWSGTYGGTAEYRGFRTCLSF